MTTYMFCFLKLKWKIYAQNVFNNPLEDLWSLESKKIQGLWHTEIARKKKEIWNETGKDIKEREGTEKFKN